MKTPWSRIKKKALSLLTQHPDPEVRAHAKWLRCWGAWADELAIAASAHWLHLPIQIVSDQNCITFHPLSNASDDPLSIGLKDQHFYPEVVFETFEHMQNPSGSTMLRAGGRSRTPSRMAASSSRQRSASRARPTPPQPHIEPEWIHSADGDEPWLNVSVIRYNLSWRAAFAGAEECWEMRMKTGAAMVNLIKHFARKWKVAAASIRLTCEGRPIRAPFRLNQDMACTIRVSRGASSSGSSASPPPVRRQATQAAASDSAGDQAQPPPPAPLSPLPEMPRPGWEDPVGKDQRFGNSIAIASSIERLCQAKDLTQHVIA